MSSQPLTPAEPPSPQNRAWGPPRDASPDGVCCLVRRDRGVAVYRLNLAAAPAPAALLPRLSAQEQDRACRLLNVERISRFVVRRWGLRLAIAAETGQGPQEVPLAWDPRGRPWLPGTGMRVSAASTGDLGLVALSAGPVGVDIIEARDAEHAIAALASLPIRRDAAGGSGGVAPALFAMTLWTQVEATLKAAGLDLGIPGAADGVRTDSWSADGPSTLRVEMGVRRPSRWRVESLPVPPGYTASLATPALSRCQAGAPRP